MTTKGDQILDRSLSKVGGKGLFVKELEVALEEGRADIAVHSLKDVPMELPEGFALACVMEREDPRDAWCPTTMPRWPSCRRARWWAPPACAGWCCCGACARDLKIEPLRGNLDTRLRKLDEGQYDAIVLAAAGLKRLGLARAHPRHLRAHRHAACSRAGRLGIEVRADRSRPDGRAGAAGAPAHLAGRGGRARREPRHGGQLLDAAGRICCR
jgi:hydroxymethylbilane synthase